MKKALSTIGLVIVAVLATWLNNTDSNNNDRAHQSRSGQNTNVGSAPRSGHAESPAATSSAVASAFANRRSNKVLTDSGQVIKVLSDDQKGSRHQRFLVQIPAGPTILIAHNIDLAPRVAGLREGDRVRFKGEYEWTEKGGVVHWTHHDPAGRHPGGWIERAGERYE